MSLDNGKPLIQRYKPQQIHKYRSQFYYVWEVTAAKESSHDFVESADHQLPGAYFQIGVILLFVAVFEHRDLCHKVGPDSLLQKLYTLLFGVS